jgi:hypothetical protein
MLRCLRVWFESYVSFKLSWLFRRVEYIDLSCLLASLIMSVTSLKLKLTLHIEIVFNVWLFLRVFTISVPSWINVSVLISIWLWYLCGLSNKTHNSTSIPFGLISIIQALRLERTMTTQSCYNVVPPCHTSSASTQTKSVQTLNQMLQDSCLLFWERKESHAPA